MNDHPDSKPLTQNLGEKILAAQGKTKMPRPETGIDIIETKTTKETVEEVHLLGKTFRESVERNEAFGEAMRRADAAIAEHGREVDHATEEFRRAVTHPAPSAELVTRNPHPHPTPRHLQIIRTAGDKNNEAEYPAQKETIMNEQTNGTDSVINRNLGTVPGDKDAMKTLERATEALERLSQRGIVVTSAPSEDFSALSGMLIGAGVGGVVGGVAGGAIAAYVPTTPVTNEEFIGAVSIGASLGMIGGAGVGLYVSTRPKSEKKSDKK